jgi:eukaryotic-like serine/threonine-protein kinase
VTGHEQPVESVDQTDWECAKCGEAYSGPWLAAIAPVRVPRDVSLAGHHAADNAGATNLLVLVQYRLSKVFEPVGELKRQLLIEGALLLLAIFLLTVAMWSYVNRITDPTRLDDLPDRASDPHNDPTVAIR